MNMEIRTKIQSKGTIFLKSIYSDPESTKDVGKHHPHPVSISTANVYKESAILTCRTFINVRIQ